MPVHGSATPAGAPGRRVVVTGILVTALLVTALLVGIGAGAAIRLAGRHPTGPTQSPPGGVSSLSPGTRPITFPPAVQARVGGRYWTVYLSVACNFDDPRDQEARRQARAAGYGDLVIHGGGINCDGGAREGLTRAGVRLDPDHDYATVKLFFLTRAQAAQFVEAFRPGVIGTVLMTFACLD